MAQEINRLSHLTYVSKPCGIDSGENEDLKNAKNVPKE